MEFSRLEHRSWRAQTTSIVGAIQSRATALRARIFAALLLAAFAGCSDHASSKTKPEPHAATPGVGGADGSGGDDSGGSGLTTPRFTCTGKTGCSSSGGSGPDSHPGLDDGGGLGDASGEPSGKYVAMGSSFAAGPGLPDPVPDQFCGRSTGNYAHLVASDLALDLVEASCSGAIIDNITSVVQGTNPIQIEAVTSDTRVVTITVGGNDVSYAASLFTCGADGANGMSCQAAGTDAAAPGVDPAQISALLDQVEAKLVAMLGQIRRAAPEARIYLVSYPMILPAPAAPCPPSVPMLSEDATFMGSVGADLQEAFASAAQETGVYFVDVYGASHGHDACAPMEERWVEGQATEGSAPYHPNARGMRAQADLIVAAIRQTF